MFHRFPCDRLPPRRQRGFTLVELSIAALLTLMIVAVLLATVRQASNIATGINRYSQANDQARHAFRLLLDGGAADYDGDGVILASDPDEHLPGLPGRANPASGDVLVRENRLVLRSLRDDGNTYATLEGAPSATYVQCSGPGAPHPDCQGVESFAIGSVYNHLVDDANRAVNDDLARASTSEVEVWVAPPRVMSETNGFGGDIDQFTALPATAPHLYWSAVGHYRDTL